MAQPVFRFFSDEVVFYVAGDFMCLWEEVREGSSYVKNLEPKAGKSLN